MSSNHSIYAILVGVAENWRSSGIMSCVRSDIGRDDPVPYVVWAIKSPTDGLSSIPATIRLCHG